MSSTPPPLKTKQPEVTQRDLPQRVHTHSYVAATLAVLLTLEIAAIGFYVYYRIERTLEPDNLADRVEEAVRENYSEFREEIVTHAHEKAPELANQLSKSFIAAVPDARTDLERLASRQLAAGLDTATELSAEQFRGLLQQNHAQFLKVFNAIEEAPEEAHQLVLETEEAMEQQLGVDLQRQAKMAVRNLGDLNAKLGRLAGPPESLSAKEQIERRIVRVLRAMQNSDTSMQTTSLTQSRR